MSVLVFADAATVATALSQVEAGLEDFTFMGEESRIEEQCVAIYRWLYRKTRAWYSLFTVQCLEIKLLVIVVCPKEGRTVRSAEFEKCSFGSISPNEVTRSDIDAEFMGLLGVALPAPLTPH
jgi:hypothetical protein